MCGIYARLVSEPLRTSRLHRERGLAGQAMQRLASRGPDDRGTWHDEHVVLAHTRLAVLDTTPRAAQPMVSPDGRFALVYNGEIYNYRQLRSELVRRWHFRSSGDTEVLLAGYAAWGLGVLDRLRGMFAFALWDRRERRLLLARDPLGKKPLYWAPLPDGIVAASQPKALIGVSLEPSPSGLASLLDYGFVPAPHTLYEGVFELPPGHHLSASPGGVSHPKRYWHIRFGDPGEIPTVAQIRQRFFEAVQERLTADVPVGILLSGGVDSALVAAAVRRVLGRAIPAFTVGFDEDPRFDERQAACATAEALDLPHEHLGLSPHTLPELLPHLVEAHDGPFSDSSAVAFHAVCRMARSRVTVALTGDGGDELFSGYHRLWAAALAEVLPRQLLQALDGLARQLGRARTHERSWLARAQRFAAHGRLPLPLRLVRWQHPGRLEPDRFLLRPAPPHPLPEPPAGRLLDRVAQFNFEVYLPYDLLVKADRTSMAVGLEVRSPFLDEELARLLARIPGLLRTTPPVPKLLLKALFSDLLPPHLWRPGKRGFGLPLEAWLRGPLEPYLTEMLSGSANPLFDFLQPRPVASLLHQFLAGRPNLAHKMWLLLTLSEWARSRPERRR